MQKIIDLLCNGIDLKKALDIKKEMNGEYTKRLVYSIFAIIIFMTIFGFVVIGLMAVFDSDSYSAQNPEETGRIMVALTMGLIMGFMLTLTAFQDAVMKCIHKPIDDAMKELASIPEKEDNEK